MATRYFLLLLITGMVFGCGEAASPVKNSVQSLFGNKEARVVRNLDAAQIERGEVVYLANCVNCHGQNGEATPDWRKTGEDGRYPPPPLNGTAHAWHHSTEVLKKTILKGGPPEFGSMPAWEGILTEQQVDDVIVWIKSLWPDEIYDVWYRNFENAE
ncbi:MAG: cytochrome c [Nitrosomonas sp.]|nr:cytochrome c [Nitrosomonas sp.]MDP1950257.1 cytochrome c [Nitrosomonas sp.]